MPAILPLFSSFSGAYGSGGIEGPLRIPKLFRCSRSSSVCKHLTKCLYLRVSLRMGREENQATDVERTLNAGWRHAKLGNLSA
jgi:hypothetical protein